MTHASLIAEALLNTAAIASLLAAFALACRRRTAPPGRHRAPGRVSWRLHMGAYRSAGAMADTLLRRTAGGSP